MSALERLHEKIEQLKNNHLGMKHEMDELRSQLQGFQAHQGEQQQTIDQLRHELEEKDREIEGIIAKVEELLS
jgi:peptidoglycan hydrolase CwlO-like protein